MSVQSDSGAVTWRVQLTNDSVTINESVGLLTRFVLGGKPKPPRPVAMQIPWELVTNNPYDSSYCEIRSYDDYLRIRAVRFQKGRMRKIDESIYHYTHT